MGKNFPFTSFAVRHGLGRKRAKKARTGIAQSLLTAPATALRPNPADTPPLLDAPSKPVVSGHQRYNARPSREAMSKAEARRVNADLAVSTAVKDVVEAIQESVDLIARLPRDASGRVLCYDATSDGTPCDRFIKPSFLFARITVEERNALSIAIRKHRAAAVRLGDSIQYTRSRWFAVSEGYKKAERRET
jgi:hypothetical protein